MVAEIDGFVDVAGALGRALSLYGGGVKDSLDGQQHTPVGPNYLPTPDGVAYLRY